MSLVMAQDLIYFIEGPTLSPPSTRDLLHLSCGPHQNSQHPPPSLKTAACRLELQPNSTQLITSLFTSPLPYKLHSKPKKNPNKIQNFIKTPQNPPSSFSMEESFAAMRTNLLDPAAQEFYPSSQFALHNPQNYNPYPPPPPSPFPSHYVHPPQSAADDNPSSRAVVLSMVPPHVTEPSITHSMMAFGGVRAIDTNFLSSEGIVTVHFYDLRSAQVAVAEVREQHVRQQSRLGQQFYGFFPAAPPQIGGRGLIEGSSGLGSVWRQGFGRLEPRIAVRNGFGSVGDFIGRCPRDF